MIPLFYLVSNRLTEAQESSILCSLHITPLSGVVITDPKDCDLALRFSPDVVLVPKEQDAKLLAAQYAESGPLAIISTFDKPFIAVHSDGTEEELHVSAQ